MVDTFYTEALQQRLEAEAKKQGITSSEVLRRALNTPSYLGTCGYAYEEKNRTLLKKE